MKGGIKVRMFHNGNDFSSGFNGFIELFEFLGYQCVYLFVRKIWVYFVFVIGVIDLERIKYNRLVVILI